MEKNDKDYAGTVNLEVMREAVFYNRFLRHLVYSHCPDLHSGDRVMDFGAGIGTFSDILDLPRQDMLCVESDPRQREILAGNGFQTAALDDIAVSSLAYAYSLNVLEHIPDDRDILGTLASKLKTGGHLFIYVPAFQLLWSPMDDLVGHVRRYRRDELARKIGDAGLRIVRSEYADSAGFFATLLFKVLNRSSAGVISQTALVAFDRFAFPVGRLLDWLGLRWILGKNVWVIAEKPPKA